MIQEIIVAVVGLAVLGWIGYKVYSFFFGKNKGRTACGCSSCHCHVTEKTQ